VQYLQKSTQQLTNPTHQKKN
jgi:hypothetical protein